MELSEEMKLWPRLDIEQLDTDQIDHEVFIRNIPVSRNALGVYSPASLKVIQKTISSDPYDPLTIGQSRVDSSEERTRQQVEFTRCKTGLCALDSKSQTLESYTLVQRALHFLFRLERLNLLTVGDMERKVGLRKKARNLINHYCPLAKPVSESNTAPVNATIIDIDEASERGGNPIPTHVPFDTVNTEQENVADKQQPQSGIDANQDNASKRGNTGTIPKATAPSVPQQPTALEQLIVSLNANLGQLQQSNDKIEFKVSQSDGKIDQINYRINQSNEQINSRIQGLTQFSEHINHEMNERFVALETRQSELQTSVQQLSFTERQNFRPTAPPMYDPQTLPGVPNRLHVDSEPNPGLDRYPNPTSVPEQHFTPPMNSTCRPNSNYSRRENDNNTFKKIDALSKWRLCFNGTTVDEKHLALNDYIISIERFIKLQKLNPDDVLPYLLPTLSGNARIWYNAEGDSVVTLKEFFAGLKENFDYKQNATDVMAAVLKQKFNPDNERLITHINKMECEMANCTIPSSTQLDLVLKTLPENLRMMAATRDVKNLIDLRKWALKLYPPTIGEVKTKRKEFRRFEEKRKIVTTVNVSDNESSNEENSDTDQEEEMKHQVCELVRQLKFKPKFRPRSKSSTPNHFDKRNPGREEQRTTPIQYSNHNRSEVPRKEGNEEAFCFQCRLLGHDFQNCTSPRQFSFCYDCGRPGVKNKYHCPTPSCVAQREQKNTE